MRTRGANLSQVGVPPPYAETWPIAIREVELDPPGYREVLVRIGAAGLCHSDLSVINRDPARGPCRWLSATRQRERPRRSGLGSMTSCAATMWSWYSSWFRYFASRHRSSGTGMVGRTFRGDLHREARRGYPQPGPDPS
jgi:hypothetical protein